MAKSLQDQLLAAGAVKKDRAAKIKKAKHKQARQQLRGAAPADDVKMTAQQTQTEKLAHDRALNRRRKEESERKAIAAQIRQLIEMNRVEHSDGEVPYNFADHGIVRTIYVNAGQNAALAAGRLAVARLDGAPVLIKASAAVRIRERDADAIAVLNTADDARLPSDDEYAGYQVPDDLTW